RDEEHVVPDFILTNLMLDGFPREYQADASAILYVQSMMIAVVNLKLQIAAGRDSQRIAWRPRLRQMSRKIDRWDDIQIAGGLARNAAAIRRCASVINDRSIGAEVQH